LEIVHIYSLVSVEWKDGMIQRAFYETPNLRENLLTQDLAIVYDSTSCRPYANTLRKRLVLTKSEKRHCTFSVTKFQISTTFKSLVVTLLFMCL
jgi:hypothetical protein